MKLNKLGNNETEVILSCGTVVLFSYETPVAAMLPSGRYVRTDKKWSVTTTRHINKWLSGTHASEIEQEFLDGLLTYGDL